MAKILTVIPYEFYPPQYGGALRCFYLLREMAKFHEVWLLTVQPKEVFQCSDGPTFPQGVKVISTAAAERFRTVFNVFPDRIANAANSRILKRSILGKGNLYLLNTFPTLKRLLNANSFDLVYYENLECFSVLHRQVRRLAPRVKHIYDAHNVDSDLWRQLYNSEERRELLDYAATALAQEKQLHKTLSLCFACSLIDKQKLEGLNAGLLKVLVIPNGVDTRDRPFDSNEAKHCIPNILFCGTLDYAPNEKGITWFYEKVLPLIRKVRGEMTLTVIGKMNVPGPYQKMKADPAVRFIGPVESVQPFYQGSSLLVVPLFGGSGTRLKILEAMSMGNPVVSTSIGAEGLKVENGKQIVLADDPDTFASEVIRLLSDKVLFERQRREARSFVIQNYDWEVIGERMNKGLKMLE